MQKNQASFLTGATGEGPGRYQSKMRCCQVYLTSGPSILAHSGPVYSAFDEIVPDADRARLEGQWSRRCTKKRGVRGPNVRNVDKNSWAGRLVNEVKCQYRRVGYVDAILAGILQLFGVSPVEQRAAWYRALVSATGAPSVLLRVQHIRHILRE